MTWETHQVQQFQKLVTENYGYKMFLDDLPSATLLEGSDVQYAENVPLGYLVNKEDKPVVLNDGSML
jgi:hypothetical protein